MIFRMKHIYLPVIIFSTILSFAYVGWSESNKVKPDKPKAVSTTEDTCWKPAKTIPLTAKVCGEFVHPQISCYMPADVEGKMRDPSLHSRQRAAPWVERVSGAARGLQSGSLR